MTSDAPAPRHRLVLVVILVALVAAACGGGSSPPAASGGKLLPATPTELPTFDLAGFNALLAQLKGTPVLMNIWASWCGPCVVEAPHLAKAARDFDGKVQFIGVDILDKVEPARAFIRKYGWTYPSVFDPNGAIRDGLGFLGQPVTAIWNRSGRRVFVWAGTISEDLLAEQLALVTKR
jgi:cytochrome c biogenesis protein CcmG, thiol:disulfide interchange protein DsbE